MFKSARWRSEKNKIKAVFKLQFHATQLTQLGEDALIVSVIPADIGKPTTRLEKSKVKDESCHWEKPHYETVKFTQDPKTGKFNEKIYHFVLATGSSKSSGIGEVSIDFAGFVEAMKISSVSLPLKNANSAAVLHVSIQRVPEPLDQREVDANENANRQDRSLRAQLSNCDIQENVRSNPSEDSKTLSDNLNINRRESSGSDITLSGSDSSFEPEPKNRNPTHVPSTQTIFEDRPGRASQWDWLSGSPPESTTDDSSLSSGEPLPENSSPATVINKLKTQLDVLTRQADVSELELQTLRKQIVKERKKGLDLSKELAELHEEVKVKVNERGNPWVLVDELRQELNHEKDLNLNLRLQLQKTQESNAELILVVQDLDEMIENSKYSKSLKPEKDDDDDEDQKALEEIVREHSGVQEAYLLEQKITNLYDELELYKRDKTELETQNDQIALDYEILKQENHDMSCKLEQTQIQYECTSYAIINELETHVENLEKDLENQARGFESDLDNIMNAKIEMEQRAICAEENLRNTKMKNAKTAERIQNEFRKLATQVTSSFEANENLANKLRVEKRDLEVIIEKFKQDLDYLNDRHEEKIVDLLGQITLKSEKLHNMEKQVENLEAEICLAKIEVERSRRELTELTCVSEQKDVEFECIKSGYDEMKVSLMEDESEKEKLRKEISRLKVEMKKKDDAFSSIEKKLNDNNNNNNRAGLRNNPCGCGSKEVTNLKNQIEQLEGKINLKETALKSSEASFLEKEKDLKHKLEDLERRLELLDQTNAILQASTAEEIALLKNVNKSMEVELLEMQERYSEISLKFAEVEGERQKLVMTLRNVKNTKKR